MLKRSWNKFIIFSISFPTLIVIIPSLQGSCTNIVLNTINSFLITEFLIVDNNSDEIRPCVIFTFNFHNFTKHTSSCSQLAFFPQDIYDFEKIVPYIELFPQITHNSQAIVLIWISSRQENEFWKEFSSQNFNTFSAPLATIFYQNHSRDVKCSLFCPLCINYNEKNTTLLISKEFKDKQIHVTSLPNVTSLTSVANYIHPKFKSDPNLRHGHFRPAHTPGFGRGLQYWITEKSEKAFFRGWDSAVNEMYLCYAATHFNISLFSNDSFQAVDDFFAHDRNPHLFLCVSNCLMPLDQKSSQVVYTTVDSFTLNYCKARTSVSETNPSGIRGLLRPFRKEVWICLVFIAGLVSLLCRKVDAGFSLYWAMLGQPVAIGSNSKKCQQALLQCSIGLSIIILQTFYLALYTSGVIVPPEFGRISNIKQLFQEGFKLGQDWAWAIDPFISRHGFSNETLPTFDLDRCNDTTQVNSQSHPKCLGKFVGELARITTKRYVRWVYPKVYEKYPVAGLACDSVEEDWGSVQNFMVMQGHLSDAVYDAALR